MILAPSRSDLRDPGSRLGVLASHRSARQKPAALMAQAMSYRAIC
jgi:hypothetical protein